MRRVLLHQICTTIDISIKKIQSPFMQTFNHIIAGTGQATGTLLKRLISTGDSIAVIEGNKIGGSCVNYGCTPTKTMVASAKAFHQAKQGSLFGFDAKPILNFKRFMARMNEVRNGSFNELSEWIKSTTNITFFSGWAQFNDTHTLSVGEQSIKGEKIYLAVGTRAAAPDIKGLDDIEWLDSSRILELDQLPAHLIIIGGGYIGLEFAQIFKRLGSEVTIVQSDEQIMPKEDEDISTNLQQILTREGIRILCEASAKTVQQDNNIIQLNITQKGKQEIIEGTHLLIATGRTPNSDTLDLIKAGIHVDEKGFIEVDDYCRTNIEGIFAVGDVNGRGAFTHTAVNDGEIVIDYLFNGTRKISQRNLVYALFTDPPLGRVGMTEKEALKKGFEILKATMPMSKINRAKEKREEQGHAKLIVDAKSDLILGGAILGTGGDEVINMIATIMHSGISCKEFRKIVLLHPTVSELMPYVLDGLKKV